MAIHEAPTEPPVMSTVEIPLKNFTYKFRKRTFEAEFALDVKLGRTARRRSTPSCVEVLRRPVRCEQ